MGVKFKSPLELSGHRSILHTDAAQTLIVKVVAKTAAHPEQGNGSSNGYTIDGVEGAYLEFTPGNTYKFDQSDSSNTGHPLRFFEDAAKTTAYTTGVTTNGTAGSSGAYTQIIPTISTPPVLFYQCSAHSLMGSYVKFGTATAAGSNTTYTISSETSGDDAIIRLTGSDSTTDDVTLAAGSNITIAETGDTITLSSEGTDQVRIECKNTSGGTLTKGTPVYITGTVGTSTRVEVSAANAASASTMPATGLLLQDLANNGEGYLVTGGVLKNLTTDPIDGVTPSENDTIYVKSGGGLTTTKPTGTALIQNVGKVGRVNSSNAGSIIVSSIIRSNDIPNIQQNYFWLGNASGVPTATEHALSTLTDANVTSPAAGNLLIYDATNSYFENALLTAGSNVTITNADGAVTIASTDTNTTYSAGTGISLTGTTFALNAAIEDLTNVSSTSPTTGQVLKWDGSSWAPGTDSAGAGASNSFETIAIAGQSSVVADSATDTLTLVAGNNVTLTTDAAADQITIAASTASTQLSVEKNILTGDGSTVAFTVSSSIVSENNTQVYIDGVYQSKDNYSTSGSTVTFTTAPANGAEIEIIHFVSVQGIIRTDTFTGDNSTVAFITGSGILDENNTQVYFDGVYQSKDNYTVSGSTITFSTAPSTGVTIEVVHIKAAGISTINDNQFTGDGSTVDFTLSNVVTDENNTFVFINGVYQDKSTYSILGSTLTFSTAPQNNYTIEVMQFGEVTVAGMDYAVSVISSNTTAVKKTLYVFTASLALTLPAGVIGNSIKISNRSGTETCTLVPDGTDKIMGSNATLTLDNANASFEIIFSGTAQGWVIIGQ